MRKLKKWNLAQFEGKAYISFLRDSLDDPSENTNYHKPKGRAFIRSKFDNFPFWQAIRKVYAKLL